MKYIPVMANGMYKRVDCLTFSKAKMCVLSNFAIFFYGCMPEVAVSSYSVSLSVSYIYIYIYIYILGQPGFVSFIIVQSFDVWK